MESTLALHVVNDALSSPNICEENVLKKKALTLVKKGFILDIMGGKKPPP
jgi:hypothetical protein